MSFEIFKQKCLRMRIALACLALPFVTSCAGDRCDAYVRLSLDVHVRSRGRSMAGARVGLVDQGIPGVFSFQKRTFQACWTNSEGDCSANLSYGYSFTTYPWMSMGRVKRAEGSHRFKVIVENEQIYGEASLPALNPEQLSGKSRISVRIEVP
jgi:hypothetical protein